RDLGAHFVRGLRPGQYLANYMGRMGSPTGGREGNMHFGDRNLGCVGMVSMLPDMALVACGLARAFQMRGEDRVAMTWFGEGPTVIEAVTMRMHGHGAHDDHKYVPQAMMEEWAAKDPIERYEQQLRADGIDVDAIRTDAKAWVDAETDWALEQPMPDPSNAT